MEVLQYFIRQSDAPVDEARLKPTDAAAAGGGARRKNDPAQNSVFVA